MKPLCSAPLKATTQLAERMDLLDIFLDNIPDQELMNARELSTELQNQVKLKNKPDRESAHCLLKAPRSPQVSQRRDRKPDDRPVPFAHADDDGTPDQQPPDPGHERLAGADWSTIENAILDAIDQVYTARISGLNQANSQILQNIESILKRQDEAGVQLYDLTDLAAGMPVGTQAVIDTRTHQRVSRRVSLLNYVFLAAKALEGQETDDISKDVLAHLENVQKQLQPIWGKMELQRWPRPTRTIPCWNGIILKSSAPIWKRKTCRL
jgi:hypothetical protein